MFLFYENTQEKKSNLILVLECKEVYCDISTGQYQSLSGDEDT